MGLCNMGSFLRTRKYGSKQYGFISEYWTHIGLSKYGIKNYLWIRGIKGTASPLSSVFFFPREPQKSAREHFKKSPREHFAIAREHFKKSPREHFAIAREHKKKLSVNLKQIPC